MRSLEVNRARFSLAVHELTAFAFAPFGWNEELRSSAVFAASN
jgi:hypothetical protein